MRELTASRLRRSCSLLRAASRSRSLEDCVVPGSVSVGDFDSSTSLGELTAASLQTLCGESGSSLRRCGFASALHGPGELEGEHEYVITPVCPL